MTPLRRFATLFAAFLTSIAIGGILLSQPTSAAAGINPTVNFQGRLYTASGATVPDGYYNIQFKIYQDGSGTTAGNPGGTLMWTENYLNSASQGVVVRNGFMSVELGSINAFGSSIDWNQDTLWLSMNIGNTNGSCTPFSSCGGDGEMVPMKRLSAVPYALNAMQLGGKTAGDFIQSGTTPQTANFNITGTGTAATIQTSTLDTAAAGTLSIGTTNATSITLAKSVTVSAGMSLTLTGGTTGTRPSSPSEGTLYYDSSTKQLLVYANGKWQADRSESVLVAASNSSDADKAAADYVATGTADQGVINSALTAANPGGSARKNGKVYLFAGTYTTTDVINMPNNTTLSGSGRGTLIQFGNINTQAKNMISNSDTTTGEGMTVRDLRLDGNKTVNTSGTQRGIYTSAMGGGAGATARQGALIQNVWVNNFNNHGIYLDGSHNSSVLASHMQANTGDGVNIDSSNRVNISNNVIQGNSAWGVHVSGALAIVVNGNNISNNGALAGSASSGGIVFDGTSQNNAITNNAFRDNGTGTGASNATVYFSSASNNTVTGNIIADASGTTGYAIFIFDAASTTNYFANNTINGTFSSAITNNGTNTIWGGQLSNNNSSGNYMIQPAGTVELMKNTNVTGTLAASTSLLSPSLDRSTAGTLSIGTNATNTTAISIGSGSVTTTVAGSLGVTLSGTTGTTQVCRNGTGVLSACDATFFAPTAANFIQNQTAGAQATAGFWVAGSGRSDTSLLAPSFDRGNAGALAIGGTNATSITIGNTAGSATLGLSSTTIGLGIATSATTLQATGQTAANTQGSTLTIRGATGNGTGNGGVLAIQGGNGGVSGIYGGNVTLTGGTGTTANGLVVLGTPTFSTTINDSACFISGTEVASSCTIAQSSVNNSAAILVGFTTDAQTATLPDPSITTAGRVVYVTASNLSKDFTLSVNGGGQGNQIAMRKNTTATMIWNGADWTAAGASSSTTLQAAYDNTLQSAGGAELVVSKTTATNGFTIRDSATNSVDGTLLSVQTKSAAGLFQVNSNVTEYVTNAGAETAGGTSTTFPASTWSAIGATTVARNITTTNNTIATGQASVSVATPATTQTGVKNTLSTSLGTSQNYNVSFTARLSSGTFTDMNVYYSVDGTTASVPCTASTAIATSVWTKVSCAFTAPSSGITASNAILIRQSTGTARTFYVDNLSVTIAADYNYATDGSVSDGTNFATNWSTVSAATVSRSTSVGHDASDSAQVVTAATSGQGVRNKLSINPLPSTLYRITVRAASSNTFNDFTIRYSRDNGTSFVNCADYKTQSISTSTTAFTEVTCYISTDATAATNPYVYFTQGSGVARTFYVDAFSMNLNSNTTPNVQIGGGLNGGPTTLFTLDRGASAPIASNNDALLGSMYYDTTLGKLQCYEADGWGACGSSPDNIITISPEYTNAVLHGTGIGTMTSDLCSDGLNVNDGSSSQPTICGTNETYNFYKWTSPQASAQNYGIYVTYQLPSTFKGFASGQTSLMARTDSANATVTYQVYRNSGTGLASCGSAVSVSTGSQSTWQTGTATGSADPSTCGFGPGESIVFKINVTASQNANAYVGNLNFTFSNR